MVVPKKTILLVIKLPRGYGFGKCHLWGIWARDIAWGWNIRLSLLRWTNPNCFTATHGRERFISLTTDQSTGLSSFRKLTAAFYCLQSKDQMSCATHIPRSHSLPHLYVRSMSLRVMRPEKQEVIGGWRREGSGCQVMWWLMRLREAGSRTGHRSLRWAGYEDTGSRVGRED